MLVKTMNATRKICGEYWVLRDKLVMKFSYEWLAALVFSVSLGFLQVQKV